ncbi:50S ribosomal protein L32e [Candidatus Woesearchaeota archaeon]|nr:50S ribosomal protein L32e [Candidatus Woesearchaeota archaeon]
MEQNQLLELRSQIKDKKPDFVRQDIYRRKRLPWKYKKPKGIHSKMRHHFKGRMKLPSPGYKSPAKARGLHSSGLKITIVFSVREIGKIKRENEGIIIAGAVGTRKRLEILKKAKELGITVLNINIDEQLKKIEDFVSSKKNAEKTKDKPEGQKSKDEKKELTDEQKKEAEKKEKDKLLTKKVQ